MRDEARLLLGRTARFVGTTLVHWAALNIDRGLHPDSEHRDITYRWTTRWTRGLCDLYGIRVAPRGLHVGTGNVYPGRAPGGLGRLFILNHRSGMDIPITLSYCEASMVSRADLSGWPLIGNVARSVGTLFVDRESRESGAAVLRAITGGLAEGRGIALYPEGTAYSDDEVRPLKAGAFRAAQETGAEIVPVGLAYADADAHYGDEEFLQHMRRVASKPRVEVALEVGDPILPGGRTVDELRDLGRRRLQELVDRARARLADH